MGIQAMSGGQIPGGKMSGSLKSLSAEEIARTCVAGLSDWNQHRKFIVSNIAAEIAALKAEVERLTREREAVEAVLDPDTWHHRPDCDGKRDRLTPMCAACGLKSDAAIEREAKIEALEWVIAQEIQMDYFRAIDTSTIESELARLKGGKDA